MSGRPPNNDDASYRTRTFHRKAFRLWTHGYTDQEIADRLGYESSMTILRMRAKEGWKLLAKDLVPFIRDRLIEKEGIGLTEVKHKHVLGAKRLQAKIMEMLDSYPRQLLTEMDKKGRIKGTSVIEGAPNPSEMRLLVAAYREAADMEVQRLGGEVPLSNGERFLGNFADLLHNIWEERKKELPKSDRALPPPERVIDVIAKAADESPDDVKRKHRKHRDHGKKHRK